MIWSGEGGKRRGLGPRNDVLTTCKAVALRGGQRIVALFPTVNDVNIFRLFTSKKRTGRGNQKCLKKLKNKMHLCFSCISYLSFGTEIEGETKTQPCLIDLNQQQYGRPFVSKLWHEHVRFFPTYTCNHSCYTVYVRFFVTYNCVLFPSIWPFSYKRAYICAQKSPYRCFCYALQTSMRYMRSQKVVV